MSAKIERIKEEFIKSIPAEALNWLPLDMEFKKTKASLEATGVLVDAIDKLSERLTDIGTKISEVSI